jgi:hypothetical protein
LEHELFNSKIFIMSVKGMAVSAAEMLGSRVVEKKANNALKSLPAQKQNKVRGILMVATAVIMFVSGLKLLKKSNVN